MKHVVISASATLNTLLCEGTANRGPQTRDATKITNGYTTILHKLTQSATIVIMPSRWYRSKDTLKTQLKAGENKRGFANAIQMRTE